MTWSPPSKVGDTDPLIPAAKQKLHGNSYGKAIGDDRSNVYTAEFGAALVQYGKNIHDQVAAGKRSGPDTNVTGIFDWAIKDQMGLIKPTVLSPPQPAFRNIWIYSAPGSGAPYWLGPPFEVGEWCKTVLHLNHQPLGYPIGGYLGLMGGDPGLSYNEVIAAEGAELEHQLDINPHVQQALADVVVGRPTDIEFWFTAYSQSADGMEDAIVRLFGDGGKYAPLRSRINGTLMFGNPSRQPSPDAPGWGISRKVRPDWLKRITLSITATSPGAPDFYAACDDEIRPLFYKEIVQAETSLSFAEHIFKIAIPVVMNLLGGLGSLVTPLLSSGSGLSTGLIGQVSSGLGGINGILGGGLDDTDQAIIKLLTPTGVLTNLIPLFKLLGAVSGVQTHGSYGDPHPEFGGRTGIQVACDTVAAFRR